MLRTVECEAAVFRCRTVDDLDANNDADATSSFLAARGADHLLPRIPKERWGVIAEGGVEACNARLSAADLPLPAKIIAGTGSPADDYSVAAEELAADPSFCLALDDTPAGIDAALKVGMKVIGVSTSCDPEELAAADMVIPSLMSLHVVGLHPVLVLEVDALPNIGTFHPGQIKRR